MATSAIDATVGGASSNSYATQAEVGQYMDDTLNADAWSDSADEQQRQSMIQATRLLDQLVQWQGWITDVDQALEWPRTGVVDCSGRSVDSDEIPQAVKDAQSELALHLLQANRMVDPAILAQGIKSATVGPISVTVDQLATQDVFSTGTISAIECFGIVTGAALSGGLRIGRTWRS